MAPIAALWAKIVYVLNLCFGGDSIRSPLRWDNIPQLPLQSKASQVKSYPIFDPPDELEPLPFRCEYPDYPEKDGWVACNTNTDRGCWLKNTVTNQTYDINTNYEVDGPRGIARDYYLELSASTLNPDGFGDVYAQLFNGSFPGPRLQACWGDQIQITIYNGLTGSNTTHDPGNGTTIHWHGFRQWKTGFEDGVNAVTQCPIPPGTSFTYVFNATQYGTSWYHSHYSLQYAAGALGPFTVYGPTSMNYDHQLYPIIVSDWLHESVFWEWDYKTFVNPGPIYIDNILQNGIGQWPYLDSGKPVPAGTKFNEVLFQRGVKYLMRIINGAADTTFVFSIDNHSFNVISTDFVAIEPYETDHIVVGIGQRYNIIVEAIPDKITVDQSYWIRTSPSPNCTRFNTTVGTPDGRTGIVRYTSSSDYPSTSRQDFRLTCADETYFRNLAPVVKWQVGKTRQNLPNFYLTTTSTVKDYPYYPCDTSTFHFQLVQDHPMWLNFSDPPLLFPDQDFKQKPWLTVIDTGTMDEDVWVQVTIISGPKSSDTPLKPLPVPKLPGVYVPGQHPIHLHGHDFAVLDQCVPVDEDHQCDVNKANLTLTNPPRRDVAFLPDKGYLIIAFKADNPGAWIMHCHIAFHASMGLAVQILENVDKWDTTFGLGWPEPFWDMCEAWNEWTPQNPSDPCMKQRPGGWPLQSDSGI